ncbi:MAG: ATP-binding protein [Bacteroidales bacterium]|jgi:signal transduction histidine kinase|nr:ATP-binding protein [Bacteroidales bacterium]MDD4386001.1 ATP-binding protein [Bacteroidales bacterium]MDY0196332.1 ATP-binding protein [Tenuifilaceae bacterium]
MRKITLGILPVIIILLTSVWVSQGQEKVTSQDEVAGLEQEVKLAEKYANDSDFNQASYYYSKVANRYWEIGKLEQAAEQFENALKMSSRLGNKNSAYILNTNLGLIYNEVEQYDKALAAFKQGVKVASELGRKADVGSSYLSQANIYYVKQNYNDALKVLESAEDIAKEISDQKLIRNIYSLYTKVYDKLGNREKSIKYFEESSTLTKEIQAKEVKAKEAAAQQLANEATSRAQTAEAQKQATDVKLQQKGEELTQKQAVLDETVRESRERLMQIDLLNKESELQGIKISNQEQKRKIYLAVIVLVLGFSFYLLYSYFQKKKANKLLQQKNDEIISQNIEIQQQAAQLRELNNLKDKLFSIISHDLRSPLGSLITLLNLTQQGFFTEEGFKEVIDELSKNVGYTSELLENLLNWAQTQMQGLKISPSVFKLHKVVETKLALYSEQASNKGIILRNLIEDDIEVYADSAMIELVVRNLIANSIKFCDKGSTVSILASPRNNHMMISVADTGVGMSQEQVKRIFGREIFSTLGTANEKGTGLGLMLCKDFVNLNNGEIWVKSIEGVGSEFFFTIPMPTNGN